MSLSARRKFLFLDTNVLSYLVQALDPSLGTGWPEWTSQEELRAVLAELERKAKQLALVGARKDFPNPRCLPSLWNLWSLRLADIYLLAKGGTLKSTDSFQFDVSHYTDAAYADEFVTADEELLRRARLVARGFPRCVSFKDFMGLMVRDLPDTLPSLDKRCSRA